MPNDNKIVKLLKNFIDNKAQLIYSLKQENKNIKLNKNSTYKEIIATAGERKLLSLLGLQSIDEGFRKIDILRLLSNLNRSQIRALAKELNLPGITKTECLGNIWKVKEVEISEAIKNLYTGNKISGVYQYKRIVLGPSGIIDSCCEREPEFGNIVDVLKEFDSTALKKISKILNFETSNETKDSIVQKILTNFDNEKIILVIQRLISEKQIQTPNISEWSNLIITPCGILERKDFVFHPKERLCDFLLEELPTEDIVSVLSRELEIASEIKPLLLEYCINNSPEDVIRKFFSSRDILKLTEKIFHQKPPKSVSEDEIINCVLSVLGFRIPQKIVGLKAYQKILKDIYDKIDVTVDEIMLIANETDRILKDLIEFYSKFLWDIKEGNDFKKIVTEKLKIEKHFASLSTGGLIGILRNLNELVHKDKNLIDKMNHEFNRDYLIQNKTLKILDEWVHYRNEMVHTKNIKEKLKNKQVLKKLVEFSNDIQENVYPLVVRMDKEETDKYGTHTVILKDERENPHRILHSFYIDTSVYFMAPSTKTLRINPFIVKRENK